MTTFEHSGNFSHKKEQRQDEIKTVILKKFSETPSLNFH